MNTHDILEKLNWRYAVKTFDPQKKLSEAQLNYVLEGLRLSASSFGLQPWKFVVVRNQNIREELVQHSWKQRQVADASHLIVLCSQSDMTPGNVEGYVQSIAKTRGVTPDTLKGYKDMMLGFVAKHSPDSKMHWMRAQVYIALGNALTLCALAGIDSCPMEGFDAKAYDRILKLEERGITSVVVLPVGFRSSDDKYATAKKVRHPQDQVVEYID